MDFPFFFENKDYFSYIGKLYLYYSISIVDFKLKQTSRGQLNEKKCFMLPIVIISK